MIIIINSDWYPLLMRSASLFFALFILQIVTEGNGNSSNDTGSGFIEIIIGDDNHLEYKFHIKYAALRKAHANAQIQNNLYLNKIILFKIIINCIE